MANVYKSKFKGVEVDEGVNIARNLTGTGGIEVKKTETGTINATVTIDGSRVKITPVSGTGTSTTDVMSQKAVTDELGKKQDTITNQTSLNVGGLKVTGTIQLSQKTGWSGAPLLISSNNGDFIEAYKGGSYTQIDMLDGDYTNTIFLPTGDGTLATTADITAALTGKQDKLTTGSEISIKKLQATTIGAQDNGSLTIVDPLTVSNNVYVNELEATKGVFSSGAIVQGTLTGETAHFATGVTVDGYSSFNGIHVDNSTTKPICFKRNGSIVTKMYGPTSGGGELVNVYLPGKGGTLALTSDITTAINDLKISETGGAYTVPKANSVGTINVSGVNADGIDSTVVTVADYSNAPYNLTQLEGDRLSFYYGADPDNGKICNLLAPAGNVTGSATYNIKLPQKSGTVALLSDITGGGSAGVSSIGGKTGAITLSTGLAMSGQQLVNKVKVYTSGEYLCIDTN